MKSLLLVPLLLTVVVGCGRRESVPPPARLPSARVRIASVQAADLPRLTEVTGTIRPVRRAMLAAQVTGAITDLPVILGQPVRTDEVLVKIFSAEANARLVKARSEFNIARRDLERERDLHAKGASTAETVRALEDRFTGGEAMVREAEVQLSYLEIRAPFDGVIARRLVHAGDLAEPGKALLEVEGTADFEVEARIPESFAATLAHGAVLSCEAGRVTFTGSLREISSTADPATRSIEVKISVPAEAAVRSGQFTRVQVPGPTVRALLVPVTAVSVSGQMERVFVVGEANHVVLRLVKTGANHGDRIEILSGLAESERVVLTPPAGLREGQPLEIQP